MLSMGHSLIARCYKQEQTKYTNPNKQPSMIIQGKELEATHSFLI